MDGVWRELRYFFETNALNPHGICLLWRPELIWTHAISDVVIGVAYFSIPLALSVFVRRRPDARFGWVVWMFVGFIMMCGVTHFMAVWTLWRPDYGVEALLKAVTAIVSIVTAAALWPLLPRAIALPSTAALEASLAERDTALGELRAAMATMVAMQEHEARQKLLLDELNHRVKNTLAAVQSIAGQTLRETQDLNEARHLFLERLMSLSATHNLLVKHEWERVSLSELIEDSLRAYGKPYERTGLDVTLEANLAVSVGMALHELATNAVKHGAWSGAGRVEIAVQSDGATGLQLIWRESGGPAVRQPTRRGFGSRLLEDGIARAVGGQVSLRFRSDGLECVIQAPLSERLTFAA